MKHWPRAFPATLVLVMCGVTACGGGATSADDAPALNATTFLAFGDGFTAGVGLPDAACPTVLPTTGVPFAALGLRADLEARDGLSYPSFLAALLKNRHPDQSIKMINEGVPDEDVAAGALRLPAVLQTANHPHVVLLLEGITDINQHGASTIDAIVNAHRSMIRAARQIGAEVIVSTILPERRGACRASDWLDGVNDIAIVNAQLRAVAAEEGANVIDLYSLFEPQVNTLLGPDGLYPTDAGYQKMADGFFAVIEKLFARD